MPTSQSKITWIWTTGGRWTLPAFQTKRNFKSWEELYGVKGWLHTIKPHYLKQTQELWSYRSLPPPKSLGLSSISLSYYLYWRGSAKYSTPCNNFNFSYMPYPQLALGSSTWRSVSSQLTCHSFADTSSSLAGQPVVINTYNQHLLQLKEGYDNVLAKSQSCFFPLNNITQFERQFGVYKQLKSSSKCHTRWQVSTSL